MERTEVEEELQILSAWRDSALALGLENAALLLNDQINATKEVLTKSDPSNLPRPNCADQYAGLNKYDAE